MIFSILYTILHTVLLAIQVDMAVFVVLITAWRFVGRRFVSLKTFDRFMHNHKLLFRLFPHLYLMERMTPPLHRLRRKNHTRFMRSVVVLELIGLVFLIYVTVAHRTPGGIWNDVAFLYFLLVGMLVAIASMGDDGWDKRDDRPEPFDPTPTGDAAERWLRSLVKTPITMAL